MHTQSENATEPVFVEYEVREHSAWIWLARPQYSNAQNYRLLNQLDGAFRRAVEDDAIRVIVLAARGKHFSAGHDIGTPEKDRHLPRERVLLWPNHLTREGAESQYVLEHDAYLGLCRRWQDIPKPMIAMVQGACIAGGLMLANVCDLIVASEDAFFQDPVLRMGAPGVEYPSHMIDLPPKIAREFLYLGQRMSAQRAAHFGLINRVVARDALEAEVTTIAEQLAAQPPFGLTLSKQAMNFIEDQRGKRASMDAIFHMHHLAHAHNQVVSGHLVAGLDAKAMANANKSAADSKSASL